LGQFVLDIFYTLPTEHSLGLLVQWRRALVLKVPGNSGQFIARFVQQSKHEMHSEAILCNNHLLVSIWNNPKKCLSAASFHSTNSFFHLITLRKKHTINHTFRGLKKIATR
jgi:hypothetical protein